ncbi:MAG: hypothetical protein Q9Q40_00665 [Acidobacteriota bacterium]|nr:hypothetical protein [Acidobacteriota bacterium]MDQ7086568.1 hypothetical protein [Acidobacteriota bacterium]
MADHPFAREFVALLGATQQAYEKRQLDTYLAGFAPEYRSVILGTPGQEDFTGLRKKIARDLERFDLLEMRFTLLDEWYAGETGFAHLQYRTRLRDEHGREIIDQRRNIIVGRHLGDGRWQILSKIVVEAHTEVLERRPHG